MISRTTKKLAGTVVAAVTLSLVATVAPASAKPATSSDSWSGTIKMSAQRDSGWGP